MLDLPQSDTSEYIKENSFVSNAIKMLKDWSSLKPTASTLDHLAALLAFNGHFCSAGE
jgi:hypothetical protein